MGPDPADSSCVVTASFILTTKSSLRAMILYGLFISVLQFQFSILEHLLPNRITDFGFLVVHDNMVYAMVNAVYFYRFGPVTAHGFDK